MKTVSTTAKAVIAANLEKMAAPHDAVIAAAAERMLGYAQHYFHAANIAATVTLSNSSGSFYISIKVGEDFQSGTGSISVSFSSGTPSTYLAKWHHTPTDTQKQAMALAEQLNADSGFASMVKTVGEEIYENWRVGFFFKESAIILRKEMAAQPQD